MANANLTLNLSVDRTEVDEAIERIRTAVADTDVNITVNVTTKTERYDAIDQMSYDDGASTDAVDR